MRGQFRSMAIAAVFLASLVGPSTPVDVAAAGVTLGAWTKASPTNSPPGRYGAAMAYDALRGQVVLFSGSTTPGRIPNTPNDTWTFDGVTWTQQHPATSPPAAWYNQMVYDPATGTTVLLVTSSCASTCPTTWIWDGTTWTQPAGVTPPACAAAMVYDAALGLVVAHGGCEGTAESTWTWDGTNWTQRPGTEPTPPTGGGVMTYDPAHKQVVLFRNDNAGNQTWTWDGMNWTLQNQGSPSGILFTSIAWDGSRVIMFRTADCCTASSVPSEEWAWDGRIWTQYAGATASNQLESQATPFDGVHMVFFGNGDGAASNQTWFWTSSAVRSRPYTGGHIAVGGQAPSTDAYFAEGYTGLNFHEYLTVLNPGAAQTVTAQYMNDSGVVITRQHALAANSRTTILVNNDVGPDESVSVHLSGSLPFLAERPEYFNFLGAVDGGHDAVGASSLNQTFYFAEGYTGAGFSEFLTIMNSGALAANVNVTYYFGDGSAPKTVAHRVSAHSRATILVNDPAEAGAGKTVSIKAVSDQPVLVERPMYFNYFGETGGSDVVGATGLLTDMNLAEGHVGQGFDEYLTFLNPNAQIATADVTYYRSAGAPATQHLMLPANSRTTVHVNDVLPSGTDSSVHVHSSLPILVERPMYFNFLGRTGGHDTVAVPDAAVTTTQYFAEGMVAPSFAEYYTIMNLNPQAANVTITYYDQSGTAHPKSIVIPQQSRWTEFVNNDLPAYTANSAVITSDVPILAERPMYFAY